MDKRALKGASNTTLIVVIIIMAVVAFVTVRIGPMYYGKTALQNSLDNFLSADAMRLTETELVEEIIRYGKEADLVLTEENITFERKTEGGNQIIITVNYTFEANLVVTTYSKSIEVVSNSPVWKIEEHVEDATFPSDPDPSPPSGPATSPFIGNYTDRARGAGKKISQ